MDNTIFIGIYRNREFARLLNIPVMLPKISLSLELSALGYLFLLNMLQCPISFHSILCQKT